MLKMAAKFLSLSTLVILFTACGSERNQESVSESKFEIALPGLSQPSAVRTLNGLDGFVREGENSIVLSQFASTMNGNTNLPAALTQAMTHRESKAVMKCQGRKCMLTSKGERQEFAIAGKDLKLDAKVVLYFTLTPNRQYLEICDVDGVQAGSFLGWQDVNGVIISINSTRVVEAVVDVGPFGSRLWNNRCKF